MTSNKTQIGWYRFLYIIIWPLIKIFYPHKCYGVEKVPREGAVILCPSHSNLADPFFVSMAFGIRVFMHHLAKDDTRNIPILGWIMSRMGSIFVDRDEQDINAYRSCIRVLKEGEILMAFPEGTRVHGDEVVPAKTGVIRMAAKTGAAIVPVYMPRDKKIFHPFKVVFGEPYYIKNAARGDYEHLAQELMDKIWALGKE